MEYIDKAIAKLRPHFNDDDGLDLEKEDDCAGFLGVKVETSIDKRRVVFLQEGLTKRVIAALGLDGPNVWVAHMLAEYGALPKLEEANLALATFNYASMVGMMLYLAGHTRPDIAFAVHQCARYTFCPKEPHKVALKCIGRYLVRTPNQGLILKLSCTLQIDAYPDADFAGL